MFVQILAMYVYVDVYVRVYVYADVDVDVYTLGMKCSEQASLRAAVLPLG